MRALAIAAGLAAATLTPGAPLGIGLVVVAWLVLAAAAQGRRLAAGEALLLFLALCLAAMAAVLDARWVISIDVLAAWALAAVVVAGPRLSALAAPILALRRLPPLLPPVTSRAARILRGATLGGVLVVPFAALFWSADAVFAGLGSNVPLPPTETLPWRTASFIAVVLVALGLALARSASSRTPFRARMTLGPTEWAIALGGLNALFAVFVGVQLSVLFGGGDYVRRTADLTYAEYARRGFWQLLVVAVLTLTLVGAVRAFTTGHDGRTPLMLRALLAGLCAMTLVVVVSALHRLDAYADAYGLTRTRLAADAVALGMLGLFVLVLCALAWERLRAGLGTVVLASTAAGLLVFSLSDPDGRVAQRNVARWFETRRMDVRYLQSLSADALPALTRLPEPLRGLVVAPYRGRLADDEPLTAANLSRRRARRLLAAQPASGATTAPSPRLGGLGLRREEGPVTR